jgi:hypothetical protein
MRGDAFRIDERSTTRTQIDQPISLFFPANFGVRRQHPMFVFAFERDVVFTGAADPNRHGGKLANAPSRGAARVRHAQHGQSILGVWGVWRRRQPEAPNVQPGVRYTGIRHSLGLEQVIRGHGDAGEGAGDHHEDEPLRRTIRRDIHRLV